MLSIILWIVVVVAMIIWAVGVFLVHLGTYIHIALAVAVICFLWSIGQGFTHSGRRGAL